MRPLIDSYWFLLFLFVPENLFRTLCFVVSHNYYHFSTSLSQVRTRWCARGSVPVTARSMRGTGADLRTPGSGGYMLEKLRPPGQARWPMWAVSTCFDQKLGHHNNLNWFNLPYLAYLFHIWLTNSTFLNNFITWNVHDHNSFKTYHDLIMCDLAIVFTVILQSGRDLPTILSTPWPKCLRP